MVTGISSAKSVKMILTRESVKMNIKLLEKVKAAILAEPRRINMDHWLTKKIDTDQDVWLDAKPKHSEPPCGTVGCIAGWTVVLAKRQREVKRRGAAVGDVFAIETIAGEVLDLASSRALFYPNSWPEQFRLRLVAQRHGTKAYATVVADRIDFFIKTNGTD